MVVAATIMLILFLGIGIAVNRGRHSILPMAAATVVSLCAFAAALIWLSNFQGGPHSSIEGQFSFTKTGEPSQRPDEYNVILAVGELSPSGELWRFRKLGKIKSYRVDAYIPISTGNELLEPKRAYFKGITQEYKLSRFGVRIRLGWDESGGEFLNVTQTRHCTGYMRLFTSYSGVFPQPGDDFAATRLFISGGNSPKRGSVFGLPEGRMAFVVVQPKSDGDVMELTVTGLFDSLKCLRNPYSYSNNIHSVESAREHLLRGACFTKLPRGVPAILAKLSPVLAALFFLIAAGVFIVWWGRILPGALLAVFIALFCIATVSKMEFDRFRDTVHQASASKALYGLCVLDNTLLWQDSTDKFLKNEVTANRDATVRNMAAYIINLRSPYSRFLKGFVENVETENLSVP